MLHVKKNIGTEKIMQMDCYAVVLELPFMHCTLIVHPSFMYIQNSLYLDVLQKLVMAGCPEN